MDWVPAGFSLGTGTAAGAKWTPATPTRGTGMGVGESYVQPAGGTGTGPKSQENSTSFKSTTVFVFMNLLMPVGEQKQSFDSPAHIDSKQSSKRIIQGSKL